jgi:hypothetical protein
VTSRERRLQAIVISVLLEVADSSTAEWDMTGKFRTLAAEHCADLSGPRFQ